MDEFKQKLMGLINKQGPKIPSMGFSDSNYHFPQVENLSINSKTVSEANRPADQDILESIEAAYFSTNCSFDICRFELSKLPDFLDCDQIQRDFKNLKQQHQVVSKKVLQMILEQQNACNEEFTKILDICSVLSETLQLCRTGRKDLSIAERQFSISLNILANYRKRRLAQNLLHNLSTIKNLHSFDRRVETLLNAENYAGAIEELKRCQKIATQYKHFLCVAALRNKLQEMLETTDNVLETTLAQLCFHFDANRYAKLQVAYDLLEKSQILMIDNLHVHYITAIYNTAFNTVNYYVNETEIADANGKNPYKNLCQSVKKETFIPCLVQLCKSLFKIVVSYRLLVKWHNNYDENCTKNDIEENMNRQYIRQKLDHNLFKIWDDVQWKVCNLLSNNDLATYKFDEFVQVLGIVYRLIQVGDEFCESKSEELQESIRTQSINYFRNYHNQRMEELKIFLENEIWEVCPVKPTFDILQLQEFKSLRNSLKNFRSQSYSTGSPDCGSSNHSQDGSSIITGNYFVRYADHGTPFDAKLDEMVVEEDILQSVCDEPSGYFTDDSEEDEELKREFVEDEDGERSKKRERHGAKVPILTNTTLTVLRQMGKYLQMSRLLKPIAYNIVGCMNQLFEYYLYAVHAYFTSDLTIASSSLYSNDLTASLARIKDNLFANHDEGACKIVQPRISPVVDLTEAEKLHGLAERIVAVESTAFLAVQYGFLQSYVEALVPQTNRIVLQQFYSQTISSAVDLRRPIYMSVVSKAFDLRQILVAMSKINWEVKDVMSQHNAYIDFILREIQIFTLRLEQVTSKVPIPDVVWAVLWENIAHIVTHTLVQGFSEAKKCSNGGRALMQLDFTQFLSKFEKMSRLRPMPHKEYVESYVKAYYYPEAELERWIREHGEYSSKHLLGLVSCACQNNKKTKQRLLQVVEEVERVER